MAKRNSRTNGPGMTAAAAAPASAVGSTGAGALTERSATAAAAGQRPVIRPTEEQVRQRAYLLFQARKGGPGSASEDWRRAEQELLAELNR